MSYKATEPPQATAETANMSCPATTPLQATAETAKTDLYVHIYIYRERERGRPINCWFKVISEEEGNTEEGKVKTRF